MLGAGAEPNASSKFGLTLSGFLKASEQGREMCTAGTGGDLAEHFPPETRLEGSDGAT